MNLCHFAKVIIGRSSKDSSAINYWNNYVNGSPQLQNNVPKYDTTISENQRYLFYTQVMHKYPKMYISKSQFHRKVSRVQTYLTSSKFFKNSNKSGEKRSFIETYSLVSWLQLSESERKSHELCNCQKCQQTESGLHASATNETIQFEKLSSNVTNSMMSDKITSPEITNKKVQKFLNTLNPLLKQKLDVDLKECVEKTFHLEPKENSTEKQKQNVKKLKENNYKMQDTLFNPNNDVDNFLCTGSSYSQYERERMNKYFETPESAKKSAEKNSNKIKLGLKKQKKHHGKFEKYSFNKKAFLLELKENKGENVNWTALGKKYNITNKAGIFPSNAGQILKQFASENGIKTQIFNPQKIVSGRDIIQRVRRKYLRVRGLAVPHQRPAKKIRKTLEQKINDGIYDIGICIAPKVFDTNKINNTGELVVNQEEIYGRKFTLLKIREQSLNEQETLGVLRSTSDEEYSSLPPADVIKKLHEYGKDETGSHIENLTLLKSTERTRHWKCWHDHSDILNHTYVNFMVSCIYDPAVFLSNEEFRKKFPYKKHDVQSIVEKPHLYILGQSGSSDKDQLTYVKTRTDDLKEINTPVICKTTNAPYQDVFRVFSGDNPARQFESGHQRGGHYSCLCGVHVDSHQNLECCFRQPAKSLQARLDLFKNGIQWQNFNISTNPNPFVHLKVQQIIDELDERRLDILDTRKESVSKQLAEHLEGIQRPPALFCTSIESQNPLKDLNLEKYEVLMCEPLHDLSNMVTNLITELPYHLSNKSIQKEYEIFSNITIGDRNQIRGSDARLYALKLTKFTQTKHDEGKVSEQVVDLCNSLTDIISIAYSKEDARNPRQILRLYNQTFIFGHLCKAVIGNPIKMSNRKFYGSHFHSLVTHAPEIYRLFCLRSILAENEERSFGTLRNISLNTSDRKPAHVLKNAIIRYNAQQNTPVKPDSFQHQDSVISKQAKFLPTRGPTIFKKSFINARMSLFQSHLERIADYLELGENVWWSQDDTSIIFHDCPTNEVHSLPQILHFRTFMASDVQNYLKEKWEICVQQFTEGELQLPIQRIKRLQNGKLKKIYNTGKDTERKESHSAAHSSTNEHERLTNADLHNDENAGMPDQHPEIAVTAEVHLEDNTSLNLDAYTEENVKISDPHPEIDVLAKVHLENATPLYPLYTEEHTKLSHPEEDTDLCIDENVGMPDPLPEEIPNPLPEEIPDPLPEEIPNPSPEEIPNPLPEEIPDPLPEEIPNPLPQIAFTNEADLGGMLATVRPHHITDAIVPLSSGDEHHPNLKKFIKTDVHYGNAHSLDAAHPDEHARISYPIPAEDAAFHTCEKVKMSEQHPKIAVTAEVQFGNATISCPHPVKDADLRNARVPNPQQEIAFSEENDHEPSKKDFLMKKPHQQKFAFVQHHKSQSKLADTAEDKICHSSRDVDNTGMQQLLQQNKRKGLKTIVTHKKIESGGKRRNENSTLNEDHLKLGSVKCKKRLFHEDRGQILNTETLVERILGASPEVEDFKKYRRLSKCHPKDKFISASLDQSLAKIQTKISKRQRELKNMLHNMSNDRTEKNEIQLLKKHAETLLCHWGIYFF